MTGPSHLRTGAWAEAAAAVHLQRHGLRLLQRNFRCRAGELDLIMADGTTLVFVEVRCRRNGRFGNGLDSVTRAKQVKLMAAARAYLSRCRLGEPVCRFDVVSVTKRHYQPEIVWVKDAFGQDA